MNAAFLQSQAHTRRGSTLLIALLTTAGLSVIVGLSLVNLTSRSQAAARSAAWQQAGLAAESATDLAVAEIRRVMPDLAPATTMPWRGFKAYVGLDLTDLPTGKRLSSPLTLKLSPPPLLSAGENPSAVSSSAIVEAPSGMVDSANRQWLRIRACGTAPVPGWRGPSRSKLDNQLRGIAFVRDWHSGALVSQPQVSRWIEVTVQPIPLFNSAIATSGLISLSHSNSVVDSFDSGDATKSTSGLYDSYKRQKNGAVTTNGSALNLDGTIYGTLGSSGGTLPSGFTLDGKFDGNAFQHLPPVAAPTGSFSGVSLLASLPLAITIELSANPILGAARYQLLNLAAEIKLEGTAGSSAELWVKGDLTGKLHLDDGIAATVYLSGNVRVDAGDLRNDSRRAANLQILGLQPATGVTRTITINLGEDLYASIYAPGHDIVFTGNGHVMGSVIGKTVTAEGKARFHFDEALRRLPRPIADYKVATWVEEVR